LSANHSCESKNRHFGGFSPDLPPFALLLTVHFAENAQTTFTFEIDNVTCGSNGVPDGGMTVGLLGMALLGMSVIRRKLDKQGNRRFPILVFKKQARGFRRGLFHFQR
jgi:hypothetical protein